MFITRSGLYIGAAFSTCIGVGLLRYVKPFMLKLFGVYFLLIVAIDFALAYFIVEFDQVPSASFTGWMIRNFYLLWVALRTPAVPFLGFDEIVETYGALMATVGYFGALLLWAAVLTGLQFWIQSRFVQRQAE